MESANELKVSERQQALAEWLKERVGLSFINMQPLAGDASFRRYFRISLADQSFIAMDAPPAHENVRAFAAIAETLRGLQLNAPEIIAAEWDAGFLLLTDFGDTTYLNALNPNNADQLYHLALDALVVLQSCKHVDGLTLPYFSSSFMQQEWAWHKEWFLNKWLGLTLSPSEEQVVDQCFTALVAAATSQPQVFMHRDYHSANLMVLPNNRVGLLDFQDAFKGPVAYDLVSLLRDCYVHWPDTKVTEWALAYLAKLQQAGYLRDVSQQDFLRWFDWMGLERHLKALFTFARKYVRDQQSSYLKHIPRTLDYLSNVSGRYPELKALHAYIQKVTPSALQRINLCAR